MSLSNLFNPSLKDSEIYLVWCKGTEIPGEDPNVWRLDCFGNRIKRDEYGNRQSKFGWEIDHIVALAFGGKDTLENKRPLHYKANAGMGGLISKYFK